MSGPGQEEEDEEEAAEEKSTCNVRQLSVDGPLIFASFWVEHCLELCSVTLVIVAMLVKWFLRCCNHFMREF